MGLGQTRLKLSDLVDPTFGGEGTFLDGIGSDSGDLALSRTSDSDLIFSQTQLKLIRLFPLPTSVSKIIESQFNFAELSPNSTTT